MCKRLILGIFLIISAQGLCETIMHVSFVSGKSLEFPLNDSPEIIFSGNNMRISSDFRIAGFKRSEVSEIYFIGTNDKVLEINNDIDHFEWCDSNTLLIRGKCMSDNINVYDLSGIEYKVNVKYEDDSVMLDLSNLKNGTYIVSVKNRNSIKIYIK